VAVRRILVASDAPTLRREVAATVEQPELEVLEAASGPEVLTSVLDHGDIELVIVDLQMGNMGGMAVCLDLRLQESYGQLEHVAVLMLLDRRPDVFLARRSGAEGWLVKPLDPMGLRRSVRVLLDGGTYFDESYQPIPVLSGAGRELATGKA
jgi:DNA-binding response OmpR family regulator